jgi:DNA-binding transcriptional MerR regulator
MSQHRIADSSFLRPSGSDEPRRDRYGRNETVLDSVDISGISSFLGMSISKTLVELSEESSLAARTIRFYIARGLLEGPVKGGRGAVSTVEHLARLEKIKELQAEGRTLSEIAHILNSGPIEIAAPPSPWWQYVIQDDVLVWVRGDVSPWRMKQIRAAVDEITSRLQKP